MSSRLNSARKKAKSFFERVGRGSDRRELAALAIAEYNYMVYEVKPSTRIRKNRKSLQRVTKTYPTHCNGASRKALEKYAEDWEKTA